MPSLKGLKSFFNRGPKTPPIKLSKFAVRKAGPAVGDAALRRTLGKGKGLAPSSMSSRPKSLPRQQSQLEKRRAFEKTYGSSSKRTDLPGFEGLTPKQFDAKYSRTTTGATRPIKLSVRQTSAEMRKQKAGATLERRGLTWDHKREQTWKRDDARKRLAEDRARAAGATTIGSQSVRSTASMSSAEKAKHDRMMRQKIEQQRGALGSPAHGPQARNAAAIAAESRAMGNVPRYGTAKPKQLREFFKREPVGGIKLKPGRHSMLTSNVTNKPVPGRSSDYSKMGLKVWDRGKYGEAVADRSLMKSRDAALAEASKAKWAQAEKEHQASAAVRRAREDERHAQRIEKAKHDATKREAEIIAAQRHPVTGKPYRRTLSNLPSREADIISRERKLAPGPALTPDALTEKLKKSNEWGARVNKNNAARLAADAAEREQMWVKQRADLAELKAKRTIESSLKPASPSAPYGSVNGVALTKSQARELTNFPMGRPRKKRR